MISILRNYEFVKSTHCSSFTNKKKKERKKRKKNAGYLREKDLKTHLGSKRYLPDAAYAPPARIPVHSNHLNDDAHRRRKPMAARTPMKATGRQRSQENMRGDAMTILVAARGGSVIGAVLSQSWRVRTARQT
jgi:hypothetical protein